MPHAITSCLINPKYHSKPCHYMYMYTFAVIYRIALTENNLLLEKWYSDV